MTGALAAGDRRNVAATLAGTVRSRDDLLYAVADSEAAIGEADETNNVRHSGQDCGYRPATGAYRPVLEWQLTESDVLPAAPAVAIGDRATRFPVEIGMVIGLWDTPSGPHTTVAGGPVVTGGGNRHVVATGSWRAGELLQED